MSKRSAYVSLILAAAFWGFGNIAQKTVLTHMGPLSATMLRCLIGALVMLPLAALERNDVRGHGAGWTKSILRVALTFTVAIAIQQTAYVNATVVNASFLVNTATVLTPVVAWASFGETTRRLGVFAACLTLAGIGLMADGIGGFAALNTGDVACLVSAVFYAFWMVLLGRHARRYGGPFTSAFVQFAIAALLLMPVAPLLEPLTGEMMWRAAPELAMLGILSTAAAFGLQTYAQRHVPASKAAVLVSGESIFGAIGACLVLLERPPVMACVGAALIFLSIVIVTIEPEDPVAALLQRNAEEE
ncbi:MULTISPECIES: DMT family transporter [unclassified Rhizobium]|uniref:DMT family transporter n=1 Tax=unclassified Rhizobium TaxID=2613769 RepID=UPI001ADA2249|nr:MULTISPECIES: DMT family transporter [unclassified Rhizobium]MBO9122862.1 DMT family transporter [Rhizobium sp. 16-488-2b]MBO9173394.1 DMT family transporter [Rhizobium sp. 16-488-2a]